MTEQVTERVKLKPCPFCGCSKITGALDMSGVGDDYQYYHSIWAQVIELAIEADQKRGYKRKFALACETCGIYGPWTGPEGTMLEAVDLWNKRGGE